MTTVHGANNFKQTPQDRKSRSRLEARDRKTEILDPVSKHETERQKFSISSRSMRLKGRNSRSRLEAWDWQAEILDLVSKHETERKKFSISSQELRNAFRYALILGPNMNMLDIDLGPNMNMLDAKEPKKLGRAKSDLIEDWSRCDLRWNLNKCSKNARKL